MSVIVRERERERERDRDRDWDTSRSVYESTRESTREGPRTFTTVRRYKVPDRSSETERFEGETRIVRRERVPSPPDNVREWRIEREVDRDVRPRSPPSSVRDYRSDRDYRIERDFAVEREVTRAPSPPAAYRREVRVIRNEDREEPARRLPFDVERYSKSTEFFARPEAPQPIIIREPAPQPIIIREAAPQPIIIRERSRTRSPPRPREESYEMIERSEVQDNRSVVRREEPPPPAPAPQPKEEDYYYERRVREVERPQRRESFSDEEWDRRREVHPRESASQYGDEQWSSDEDLVYYKKRGGSRAGSREASPHHRRHLAEGALAGVVGGELLRRHRKNDGEAHGGRLSNAAAGGIIGVAGAEAVSRIRSRSRRRKEERSRSESSDRGRKHRHRHRHHHKSKSRSRSRSRSKSRARQLAGLAGVAAVGALAGYALKQRGKNQQEVIVEDRGRSRSRVRAHSADSYDSVVEGDVKHADLQHRNRRIAQAGLASAAVAGLVERARSKSRQRKGDNRSRSRIRQGVPIAAAGLGGAALAGLYERSKGKKEERELEERSRSRPRSRSVPPYEERRAAGDPALIEYGGEPIYPGRDEEYYRMHGGRGYDDPAEYRRHRRGSSASSSPGGGRDRSRSRSRARHVAETAAVAGAAGLAAHKATQRSERKRAEKERRRREEEDGYPPDVGPGAPYSPGPPGAEPYAQDPNYYPHNNAFPPPPNTGAYPPQQNIPPQENPYPPYNPADYGPMPGANQPALANDQYFSPPPAAHQDAYNPQTAAPPGHVPRDPNEVVDGVSTPTPAAAAAATAAAAGAAKAAASTPPAASSERRGRAGRERERRRERTSSAPSPGRHVQFNLRDQEHSESEISPMEDEPPRHHERRRHRHEHHDDAGELSRDGSHGSTRHVPSDKRHSTATGNPYLDRGAHRSKAPATDRETSPARSDNSESTVDLPPRFDRKGRPINQDPLAQSVQDMFQGKGMAGRLFQRFAGDILR
ncbi:MAG: hypothetical protein M1822_005486 [Bathelium mastoideum]|nr:MAG: hypothetical protein M1822_005486 [Bathelium mastoideum]